MESVASQSQFKMIKYYRPVIKITGYPSSDSGCKKAAHPRRVSGFFASGKAQ